MRFAVTIAFDEDRELASTQDWTQLAAEIRQDVHAAIADYLERNVGTHPVSVKVVPR